MFSQDLVWFSSVDIEITNMRVPASSPCLCCTVTSCSAFSKFKPYSGQLSTEPLDSYLSLAWILLIVVATFLALHISGEHIEEPSKRFEYKEARTPAGLQYFLHTTF